VFDRASEKDGSKSPAKKGKRRGGNPHFIEEEKGKRRGEDGTIPSRARGKKKRGEKKRQTPNAQLSLFSRRRKKKEGGEQYCG